ncbi:MAG: zf-HC2 domain-containing protein [Candidatus Omnitrophica bacterium]|nr:zf-HC2 domain-containing protein [Candidatus Omnitrophota bacterium]
MDCQDCKKLLSKFLDNELDKKQQLIMTKHIEDCPACAQSLESITEMVNMLHKIKAINPPADFTRNVNKRLDHLPFWDKVLIGIKSVFFSNPPIKSFALLASLILVFVFTGQLNNHHGKMESVEEILVSKQNSVLKDEPSRRESVRAKTMLSEPASAVLELAEADISRAEFKTDKGLNNPDQNMYIKANNHQVLILSMEDPRDIEMVKQRLELLKAIEIKQIEQDNVQILSFKISYENFLSLHSMLAGLGVLEKVTPNVDLHDNPEQSLAWQQEAFKQLISVELKISK